MALATPHFQVALAVVARTNYVTVLPRRIAQQQRVGRKLSLLGTPIALGTFSLALFWHERTAGYPLHDVQSSPGAHGEAELPRQGCLGERLSFVVVEREPPAGKSRAALQRRGTRIAQSDG